MSYKQRLQIQRLQKTVTNNERLQTTVSKQPLQRLKKQLEINKTTKKHFQVMVTDYMFKKKIWNKVATYLFIVQTKSTTIPDADPPHLPPIDEKATNPWTTHHSSSSGSKMTGKNSK